MYNKSSRMCVLSLSLMAVLRGQTNTSLRELSFPNGRSRIVEHAVITRRVAVLVDVSGWQSSSSASTACCSHH